MSVIRSRPRMAYHKRNREGAVQVIPHATSTRIDFNNTISSAYAGGITWDNANKQWVAGRRGLYLVGITVRWSAVTAGGRRAIHLETNSTLDVHTHSEFGYQQADTILRQQAWGLFHLRPGDYVNQSVFQNSGGNINVENGNDCHFEIAMVQEG